MKSQLSDRVIARVTLLSGALLLIIAGPVSALEMNTQLDVDSRVTEQVLRFGNEDWHQREDAFYRLLDVALPGGFGGRTDLLPSALDAFLKDHPSRREQIVIAVVDLLQRETTVSRNAATGSLTEEFENYLGDLIAAAAALRDQRAADALLPDLRTGNMASKAVATFGSTSVDGVIAVLGTGDIADRIGAIRTLAQMLDPNIVKIDSVSRMKIKAALLGASKDQHFAVRDSAVGGLAKLPDADVTTALKQLATDDPYSRPGDAPGSLVYPVRNAAAKALALRGAQ